MAGHLRVAPQGRRPRSSAEWSLAAGLMILFWFGLTLSFGCGGNDRQSGFSSQEKIAYIAQQDDGRRLMLTTASGGTGHPLLSWRGYGERFSFSNDGRYLSANLMRGDLGTSNDHSNSQVILATTDGSTMIDAPGPLTFSPDSVKAAYVTVRPRDANELGILDLVDGTTKVLARGGVLMNPLWTDDQTLVYTMAASVTDRNGVIYRVNVNSGETAALTGPDRAFSNYSAPVSFLRPKIALTEAGPFYNIWSMEVASGRLTQVTNNSLFNFRPTYLPQSNNIIFEQQKSEAETMSSELAQIVDDGSEYRLLTSDFDFDGLNSFSLASGRIVYQKKNDSGETSIFMMDADGGSQQLISKSGGAVSWVGDPNFAPVEGWRADNPLRMTVSERPGKPLLISVKNISETAAEASLRAFPGLDLLLTSTGSRSPDLDRTGMSADYSSPGISRAIEAMTLTGKEAQMQWKLTVESEESIEIELTAMPRPTVSRAQFATLLLTLSVSETPPLMYWQDFG